MRSAVSVSGKSDRLGVLKISVDWDEAGTVHVPYLHKRYGLTFFATETLRPRQEPFHLFRELARGQLSRVMKRVADWQSRGLRIPTFLTSAIHEGVVRMTDLSVKDVNSPDFDEKAISVFESLVFLSQMLLDQFIDQSLAARQSLPNDYPLFLGFQTKRAKKFTDFADRNPEYRNVFQAWNPSCGWKEVEPEEGVFCWDHLDPVIRQAKENHWRVFLGPLVRWNRADLPHWIHGRLDDPYSVRKSLFRYAEAVIHRYPQINQWVVSSGIASELDYILVSKRIEWADALARIIRTVNPSARILIGMDQPWGDALRFSTELPPLELGERLAQSRYVDGFVLSLNLGLSPEATLPRDAFELNWLLDQWSVLGKPLYFSFSVPSYPSHDVPHWETPEKVELPWNLKTQQETASRYLLSFLTRKSISGVFWNHLNDVSVNQVPPSLFSDTKKDTKAFAELAKSKDDQNFDPDDADFDSDALLTTSPDRPPLTEGSAFPTHAGHRLPPPVTSESTVVSPPEITALDDEPDAARYGFPHSGLITSEGNPKPAFRKLAALQHAYLG